MLGNGTYNDLRVCKHETQLLRIKHKRRRLNELLFKHAVALTGNNLAQT